MSFRPLLHTWLLACCAAITLQLVPRTAQAVENPILPYNTFFNFYDLGSYQDLFGEEYTFNPIRSGTSKSQWDIYRLTPMPMSSGIVAVWNGFGHSTSSFWPCAVSTTGTFLVRYTAPNLANGYQPGPIWTPWDPVACFRINVWSANWPFFYTLTAPPPPVGAYWTDYVFQVSNVGGVTGDPRILAHGTLNQLVSVQQIVDTMFKN